MADMRGTDRAKLWLTIPEVFELIEDIAPHLSNRYAIADMRQRMIERGFEISRREEPATT